MLFAGIGQASAHFDAPMLPREVGTITSIATGIAKVSGLPGVGFEELVQFPGGVFGIAFNVDEDEIGVVLLGEYSHLHAGDEVDANRPGHGCRRRRRSPGPCDRSSRPAA